jgi:FADH2 O2-dependent halogenase
LSARYDVAILGAGLAGTMLGTILSRQGLRVLVLEAGVHPRFAIGESLIPETTIRFKLMAARWQIPEFNSLATFHKTRDDISPACGVKRSFAFAYHREGERHRADESHELPTLTPPLGPDSHFYRQDVDQWLLNVALKYGVDVRQRCAADRIELGEDVVRLHAGEQVFEADFLVDGAGMRSPLSQQLSLRDETPRFRTDTRCLFTHMVGVTPYDRVGPPREAHGLPTPFSQSTLHHCFDGGWLWVIPFDNHRESTNAQCSVGLLLDRRKHPDRHPDPAAEFRALVARYPSIADQFADAKAVRPWVSTGRLQFSSKQLVGHRWALMPHAGGFVDPLYSSGLSITAVAIDLLASRLLAASQSGDWSADRFADVEQFVQGALDHYDMVVANSFDSWRSFDLWNAWQRVWGISNIMGTWGQLGVLMRYEATGDRGLLELLEQPGHRGVLSSQLPELQELRAACAEDLSAGVSGEISEAEAGTRMLARLGAAAFFPPFLRIGDPNRRYNATFSFQAGARQLLWYRFRAPERWRTYCYFPMLTYAWSTLKWALTNRGLGNRRKRGGLRDVFYTWNRDWTDTG